MSERPGDDIEARIEDLERALREVRDELRDTTPRGPFGFPRPPSPDEVLRFADEAAIPAAIAILEANIRVLEGIRRAIRLSQTQNRARDRANAVGREPAELGRKAIDRFDAAIADLEDIVEGTPADVPGSDVLREARELRNQLDTRITNAEDTVDEHRDQNGAERTNSASESSIDIEAELDSIKREQANQGSENNEDDEQGP